MALNYNLEPNAEVDGELVYQGKNNFGWHVYAVTVWIGNLFYAIFGGVGIVMLPYSIITEYRYRPKRIVSSEFERRKRILLPKAYELREKIKSIEYR